MPGHSFELTLKYGNEIKSITLDHEAVEKLIGDDDDAVARTVARRLSDFRARLVAEKLQEFREQIEAEVDAFIEAHIQTGD